MDQQDETSARALISRLWSLCHILRDDGITYHEYVTELTFLLFLKIADETHADRHLPAGQRWQDLRSVSGPSALRQYRSVLSSLGRISVPPVNEVFSNARTKITRNSSLVALVKQIDSFDWYSAKREGFGELYEGILEKNATEKKGGAGQYFTPRCLIDCLVALTQPRAGETIQDPAAGTAGFLISADRWVRSNGEARRARLVGMELVGDVYRLGLMNIFVHGAKAKLLLGDALSEDGMRMPRADVILTNPPFGAKKGGWEVRGDLARASYSKQFAFIQHALRSLKPQGRAAIIVPDNVLFENGRGGDVRRRLINDFHLHTILRLPNGIFYAPGVKTNVLFFTTKQNSRERADLWVYDLRSDSAAYGKTKRFSRNDLAEFEQCFGPDPWARAKTSKRVESSRFRAFTRAQIAARSHNLDIAWTKAEPKLDSSVAALGQMTDEVVRLLRTALAEVEELATSLASNQKEVGPP